MGLKLLQHLVGGYIEIVELTHGQSMVVNEEGKLHELEPNAIATAVFRAETKRDDLIVGNAVVCFNDEMEQED